MADELTLVDTAKRLFEAFGERSPSYRQLLDRVQSGRLPAFRAPSRAWMIRATDLERVAVAFDLRPTRLTALNARIIGGRAAA